MASDFSPHDIFAVAPMIDVTTRTFRRFARLMTKKAMLYTEMVAANALVHGKEYLIEYDHSEEGSCTLQLGGCDPQILSQAAKIGEKHGYSAINLNCGCPSDKVFKGDFGAVLMKKPELICDCVKAMRDAVSIPVTVKTRIGVDEFDSPEFTLRLISNITSAGSNHVILHCRKAWLHGLSPKENRTVPPLDYARAALVKEEFPNLCLTVNGGITSLFTARHLLLKYDGVMLGRAIIDDPYILAGVDAQIFKDESHIMTRDEVFSKVLDFTEVYLAQGHKLSHLGVFVQGLFNGCHGARRFRNYLSTHMHELGADAVVFVKAYEMMKNS